MSRDLAVKVKAKVPFGKGRNGRLVHRVRTTDGILERGGIRYRAWWHCHSGSIDAVLLPAAGQQVTCSYCAVPRGPVVYRCYNADDVLLYVGYTGHYTMRMKSHIQRTPWWPQVADTRFEHFPSAAAAHAAEVDAIRTESPSLNRTHLHRDPARVITYDPAKLTRRFTDAGITRLELAEQVGCSGSLITYALVGGTGLSDHMLERIADALGCKIGDLLPAESAGEFA